MKLILVILSLFAATCYGQAKLKIGIKKRVECTIKTRKNDLVHIHYTARQIDNDGPRHALNQFNFFFHLFARA